MAPGPGNVKNVCNFIVKYNRSHPPGSPPLTLAFLNKFCQDFKNIGISDVLNFLLQYPATFLVEGNRVYLTDQVSLMPPSLCCSHLQCFMGADVQ